MFKNSVEFHQLADLYTSKNAGDSIGLYLGAGINLPTEDVKETQFKTYLWDELLYAIYEKNKIHYHSSFEEIKLEYGDNWPAMAEALTSGMSVEALVGVLDEILYQDMPRNDKRGRLTKKLLTQAPTLQACICFTARIKNRVDDKWTFERNPKIQTVITPNYDFFFGAGWTRYQRFRKTWKVQTRKSDKEFPSTLRTVSYIHGYIPYRRDRREEIVLTRDSYDGVYGEDGFARKTLENAIRDLHLIFMGTSFSDPPVIEILKNAKAENYGKCYFSIEKSPSDEKLSRLNEMGILPIQVEEYREAASVLEEIYCAGLAAGSCKMFGLNPRQYWERLKQGPNAGKTRSGTS